MKEGTNTASIEIDTNVSDTEVSIHQHQAKQSSAASISAPQRHADDKYVVNTIRPPSYEQQLALVESMMTCYDTPLTQAAGYTRDLLKTIITLQAAGALKSNGNSRLLPCPFCGPTASAGEGRQGLDPNRVPQPELRHTAGASFLS